MTYLGRSPGSNGSVWVINPRGIVFGAHSRVDVGGLVASTLSITQDDLNSGRLQLGPGAGAPGELRADGHGGLPPFVEQLRPGIGWAPDPGGGRSFGQAVSAAVASAAEHAEDATLFATTALAAVRALRGMDRSAPGGRAP